MERSYCWIRKGPVLGLISFGLLASFLSGQAADELALLREQVAAQRAEIDVQREQLRQQQVRLDQQAAALEAIAGRLAATESVAEMEKMAPVQTGAVGSGKPSSSDVDDVAKLSGDIRETLQLMTGSELVSDDFPASWPMFGTDMRMKIGGYIKADFVADFDGTRDPTQFLMSTIPVEGSPGYGDDAYIHFFAKETRFNLDVRRIAPDKLPLRGFIEGDFFSTGDSFRLRHAYIAAGDLTIGQTWTTLSFLEALPFMIDFGAGDALFGGRAVQVRYQHKIDDKWKVSAALEELSFLGIENSSDLPGKATRQLPLLALRADYLWDGGLLLMGTSLAQLHWDGGATGLSDSALQYDFVVAGRHNLGPKSYASWSVAYGEGSGENILAFAGSSANAVLNPDGTLETFPALSVVLGYGIDWTDTLSSNLAYAYGWLDTPDTRDPLALKRGGIGHVNLIWKPAKQFSTGIEFMWGTSRAQNDALGRAKRLQTMAKFEF